MNGFERIHECVAHWTDAGQYELTNEPIVRCKDCTNMSRNLLVGCGCICKVFGFTIPDPDGFCAWGEAEEQER